MASVAPYLNRVARFEVAGLPIGKTLVLGAAIGAMDGLVSLTRGITGELEEKMKAGEINLFPIAVGAGAAFAFGRVRQVKEFLGEDATHAFILASLLVGADQSFNVTYRTRYYIARLFHALGATEKAAAIMNMSVEQWKAMLEKAKERPTGAMVEGVESVPVEAPSLEAPSEGELGGIPAGAGIANIEERLRSIRLPS